MSKKKGPPTVFDVMELFVQALPQIATLGELRAAMGWMSARGEAEINARPAPPTPPAE